MEVNLILYAYDLDVDTVHMGQGAGLAMKAIIQRVSRGSVSVDGELISSIGRGLCVLVGIHKDDTEADKDYLVRKVLNLRIFDNPDNGKRWDKSAKDLNLEILCISQFTLYHTLKGNKCDFSHAMPTDAAHAFYAKFLSDLGRSYAEDKIKDGQFGAMMQVEIVNDGPVTLEIASPPPKAVVPSIKE
eukprot:snap_masked-scaffold373_size192110-processed-gene-0.13 protein:Tk03502 transcript:snap_masked-scaffold373_size192110-processed-gene-0.13-mRNA-1 annotation:"d-tyrosyl-trna deacylase 1"